MKIGGFDIGKKQIIAVGAVVGVIAIATAVSSHNKQKEIDERIAAEQARLAAAEAQSDEDEEELSDEEEEKQMLIKLYGEPPEGFMWNDDGELYAISDENKTAEEVVYTYIRSLSIQDFSSAQKCARKSTIARSYSKFFEDATDANYYSLFLRKQYKFAITSIEILGVDDSAVFADGTTMVTMKLKVLDLTNKDFWQSKKDEIYKVLRTYRQTETDSVKADQYLYDFIYSSYENGLVGKKDITVSFKLVKKYGSGWLIEDDSELNHHLLYEEGVDVVPYIRECYSEWLEKTMEAEQEALELKREREQERLERQMEKEEAKREAELNKKQ